MIEIYTNIPLKLIIVTEVGTNLNMKKKKNKNKKKLFWFPGPSQETEQNFLTFREKNVF